MFTATGGNVVIKDVKFKVNGESKPLTPMSAHIYDISASADVPAGAKVDFDVTVTGTDGSVSAAYSSTPQGAESSQSATSDLVLVSVNPTITLLDFADHSVKINGGAFTVSHPDDLPAEPEVTRNVTTDSTGKTTATKLGVGTYTVTQTATDADHAHVFPIFTFKISADGKVTDLTETESPSYNLVDSIITGLQAAPHDTLMTSDLAPGFTVYNVKNLGELATTGGFYTWLLFAVVAAVALVGALLFKRRHDKAVKA